MRKITLLICILISFSALGQGSTNKKSNKYYDQALGEEDREKKIRLLSLSLKKDENNIKALLLRGITYEDLQHYKEAENDYLKVLSIDPENQAAFFNYGTFCLYQNRFDSAVILLRQLAYFSVGYLNLGIAYLNLDSIDLAYKCVSKVVQRDSSDYRALETLAVIFLKYEDYKTAAYLLDKSENIKPTHIPTHLTKLYLFSRTQQKDQALKEYSRIKNENLSMDAAVHASANLMYAGLLDQSLELCLKALKMNGNKSEVYNLIGVVYMSSQKYSEAIESFKSSISENENNVNPYINIGCTYNEMKQFKNAIDYYLIAMKKFSNTTNIYNNIGYAYLMDNQLENAKTAIEKAIEIDPKNSYAYKNYALFYKNADSKKACDLINKAIDIDKELNYQEEYLRLKKDLCK